MLKPSIVQDRSGFWIWEILDGQYVYVRSERSFAHARDARNDLDRSCHLIRSKSEFALKPIWKGRRLLVVYPTRLDWFHSEVSNLYGRILPPRMNDRQHINLGI